MKKNLPTKSPPKKKTLEGGGGTTNVVFFLKLDQKFATFFFIRITNLTLFFDPDQKIEKIGPKLQHRSYEPKVSNMK